MGWLRVLACLLLAACSGTPTDVASDAMADGAAGAADGAVNVDASAPDATGVDAAVCTPADAGVNGSPAPGRWLVYMDDETQQSLYGAYVTNEPAAPVLLSMENPAGRLRDNAGELVWSPDGARLVYRGKQEDAGTIELYLVDLSSSTPTGPYKLNGSVVDGGDVFRVAWSPGGDKVAYVSDEAIDGMAQLYVVDVSGATPAPPQRVNSELTMLGMGVGGFAWSPDGSHLLYRANQEVLDAYGLYRVDVQGSTPAAAETIAVDVEPEFAYAPAGDHFYYIDSVDGPMLYAPAIAGDHTAPLGSTPINWSPDGRWLAVANGTFPLSLELVRVDSTGVDGPIPLSATAAPIGTSGAPVYWAPDSTALVYEGYGSGLQLAFIDGDSVVPPVRLDQSSWVTSVAWSFDSRSIAYLGGQQVPGVNTLHVAAVTGSGATSPVVVNGTLLPDANVMSFRWSPDSSAIAYVAAQATGGVPQLWVARVSCGTVQTRFVANNTLPLFFDAGVVGQILEGWWSSDGSRVAYQGDQRGDFTFELFTSVVGESGATHHARASHAILAGTHVTLPSWQPLP